MPALLLFLVLLAAACSDVEQHADLVYDSRFGSATTMDVYVPDDDKTERPAVVWIHGGGWKLFSKEVHHDHSIRFAEAGYVAATINYRLVPDGVFPANVQDVLCALADFRSRADTFGFDPERVALIGYSAGGHLASLVGVASQHPALASDCEAGTTRPPNAVISGAGPQDMTTMPQVSTVTEYMGGSLAENRESYELASPVYNITVDAPPFLFIHGESDAFVDVEQSKTMRERLLAQGTDARLFLVPSGGHIVNPGADLASAHLAITVAETPEAWAAMLDFLDDAIGAP